MKRSILLFLIFLLLVQIGCIAGVRYSPDEIKDFPPAIQERIRDGEVVTGMTLQQVRYAWGEPTYVNVLPPAEGGKYSEEWVYTKMLVFKTRLIFVDGKLTEIITNEPGVMRSETRRAQ
ncbi:MAG: hypothetical protein HY755_06465 [Nitrospirae bacterium]|nr:hypothetical protein [Nitrospirota bacterium]